MPESDFETQISGVAALKDPTRRALYRFVLNEGRPVTRDEAAQSAGVPRSVAAFHLDRLVEAGLLEVEFRRLSGRSGPGAGRPSKLYRRGTREMAVSLPERRYDVVGRVLARAVTDAMAEDRPVAETLEHAASDLGRTLGREARERHPKATVTEALDDYGFEPRTRGEEVVLGNCPFHALADEYRELVCGMNVHLVKGVIQSLGVKGVRARLQPEPGLCCVRLRAT